jgi:secondary thiamine-phosphate synthase enzyme
MKTFSIHTKGHYDFIDVTEQVSSAVTAAKAIEGVATVFVAHSTAALTVMEHEAGIIEDLKELFERWAPAAADYRHHSKWGDRNGAAHMKSAIIGTDLAVPVHEGALALGTWQRIVLIDFDEKPRTRSVHVAVISSS